jgi:hypothetical protein
MNVLIRKELRLMFPAWITALLAGAAPLWTARTHGGVVIFVFGASVFFLGLASFGQEMSFGTFSLLLAQPEERRRWWKIKAGLSALAMFSALTVAVLAWLTHGCDTATLLGCATTTVVAYAGGLWSALLLRDMIAAFFVSFLTPLVLLWVVFLGFSHWIQTDRETDWVVCSVLLVYSVVGFWFGRRLFLQAQDIPWTGGMRALPSAWSAPARWFSGGVPRKSGPWGAFMRKEFQQQEAALALALFLAVGHMVAIGTRYFYPLHSGLAREFLDLAWIFWLIVPVASGSVAVAEERRLRTHEVELCLPFSLRMQFFIKLLMVLAVGIGLGGVVPWLLESGASAMGLGAEVINREAWSLGKVLLLGSAGIVLLAFYASTLTNRVVPALATVVCLVMGIGWILGEGTILFGQFSIWLRPIFIYIMEGPAMTAVLVWLAYRNYKSVQTGWRIWLGNLGWAAAVFAMTAVIASGIYNRVWEMAMTLEPQHGAARITGPGRVTVVDLRRGPVVLLPDGRLWMGKRETNAWTTISGAFISGSNWVSMAGIGGYLAAIKSDGTLWDISNAAQIRQMGTNADWQKVVCNFAIFCALQRDGTLWEWGYVRDAQTQNSSRVPYIAEPEPVGGDSGWVDIFATDDSGWIEVIKNDGTTWHLLNPWESRPLNIGLTGTNWLSLAHSPRQGDFGFFLGVRNDGTLWASDGNRGDMIGDFNGKRMQMGVRTTATRVGDKSDWTQLSASYVLVVGLESNGDFSAMEGKNFHTWHPSKYHDWSGVGADYQCVWALAADGTLCCWDETEEVVNGGAAFDGRGLLRLTRRPVVAINILDSK